MAYFNNLLQTIIEIIFDDFNIILFFRNSIWNYL
jgi:hypothetical protein